MKAMSLLVFPYRKDAKGDYYPVIPIALISGNKKREYFALIDSGATISIFRPEVSESLGIIIEKGKEVYLGGVGGRIKGFIHNVKIEIAGKTFTCPVVFSNEYYVSLNLLGRSEFFERFKITFEEKKRQVKLE